MLGAASGMAGMIGMRYYWKAVDSLRGKDPRKTQDNPPPDLLDNISLVGQNHRPGESSTAAMGRILYTRITGKEPESEELKTTLSYLADWAISAGAGGLYGALRGRASLLDLKGMLALGTGLWLFGDELGVGLLGLTAGPTAYPLDEHAYSFGAHLAYSLPVVAITRLLFRLLS
jgi:hypothetical protein